MNYVVTGATSFIGLPVVERLLDRGQRVFAVVRPGSSNRERLNDLEACSDRFTVVELSLDKLFLLPEHISETCDGFLHFGWDGAGSDNRTNRGMQQKNVEDSLKALEAAARLGCGRFLFSGSQAEYGVSGSLMEESLTCRPVSEYGKAKVEFGVRASALCEEWRRAGRSSMDYVHTRIFSVYGPGDHPWSLVESCMDAFLEGREISLGECSQLWNFLYRDDLVEALLALLFYPGAIGHEQVFNIAGDEGATRPLREYVEEIYRICGRRGTFCYGTRLPNAEGPANLIPDITRIQKLTGWKPEVSFEDGIGRLLEHRRGKI